MTSTVFTLPGAFGVPSSMPPMLGGAVTKGNVVVPINYPNWTSTYWPTDIVTESDVNQTTCTCTTMGPNVFFGNPNIEVGACMLNQAIVSTPGKKVVFAHSLGCAVGTRWLVEYGPTSNVSPEELLFVFIGNSIRAYGGFVYVNGGSASPGWGGVPGISASNPYPVIDIARQFEGWCDWPDDYTTNFGDWITAAMNAQIGMNTLHAFYEGVSINDPTNAYLQVGNVTYIINPTQIMPMANQWFYSPALQQQMDKQYRPNVYKAYSYYDKFVMGGISTQTLGAAVKSHGLLKATPSLNILLSEFLPSFEAPAVPEFPPANRNNLGTVDRRNYDALMVPIDLGTTPTNSGQPAQPDQPTATDIAVQIYTSVFSAPAVPATIINSGNGIFNMSFGNVASGPPNGGMFVLSYGPDTTGPIIFSTTGTLMALAMEGALWSLPDVGWGGVSVTATTDTEFTFQFTTPSGSYELAIGDNSGSPAADPAGLSGAINNLIQQGENMINGFLQGFFGIPGVGQYSTAIEV